jgi:hypothetical protein
VDTIAQGNVDLSDLDFPEGVAAANVRKLRDLGGPAQVAQAAESQLVARRGALERLLTTRAETLPSGAPMSDYSARVLEIVRYAREGAGACATPLHDVRRDAVLFCLDLLSCPASTETISIAETLASDLGSDVYLVTTQEALARGERILERIRDPYMHELLVVCLATLCRYRIEVEDEPVPDGWLAALCSITPITIRTYLSKVRSWATPLKRPKGSHKKITASSARRFLEEQHRAQQVKGKSVGSGLALGGRA